MNKRPSKSRKRNGIGDPIAGLTPAAMKRTINALRKAARENKRAPMALGVTQTFTSGLSRAELEQTLSANKDAVKRTVFDAAASSRKSATHESCASNPASTSGHAMAHHAEGRSVGSQRLDAYCLNKDERGFATAITHYCWGIFDGTSNRIITQLYSHRFPVLFKTRKEARAIASWKWMEPAERKRYKVVKVTANFKFYASRAARGGPR